MVALYPLVTFNNNPTAASIDTPLHAFLPFPHVDHLHPDWGIALAASANGKRKMEEFNREFGHHLAWLPWQRPGFELGMMLRDIVQKTPDCDGVVLGAHGLFTWGGTQRECYCNTLTIIDRIGQLSRGTRRERVIGALAVRARRPAPTAPPSHTQLVDLPTGRWSTEIFRAAGLRLEHAPRMVPPGTRVGPLTGLLALLPALADTALIAPASHDTASAIAGIAATGDDLATSVAAHGRSSARCWRSL